MPSRWLTGCSSTPAPSRCALVVAVGLRREDLKSARRRDKKQVGSVVRQLLVMMVVVVTFAATPPALSVVAEPRSLVKFDLVRS